jgi:hypothetical protein
VSKVKTLVRRRGYRNFFDTPSIACTWFTGACCIKNDAVEECTTISLFVGLDTGEPSDANQRTESCWLAADGYDHAMILN